MCILCARPCRDGTSASGRGVLSMCNILYMICMLCARPCRDGTSASGRGVLSMHGLSHGVVRVNSGSNLTSLTLQDCGQVLPGGRCHLDLASVCLSAPLLAQLSGQMLCVCLCVWMLTRVEQIITAAHRDLSSCLHRPTNEPCSHTRG